MRSDWPLRSLGEISISFDTRRRPVKEAQRIAGPFPYYGASGVVDHVNAYLFDGEYLLVAEDGENLRTQNTPIAFRATGKFWVNNHAHIIQGNSEASTRYLQYALLAADIAPYLTGAVMPKLTQGNLNKILLPCPSHEAQVEIVGVLGLLDDRIELLRQTNTTLETIAQALFKSWFVDFDPVRAKAEGREPDGMDAATAALFPDSFEDSPLGPIPQGWHAHTFGDLLESAVGGDWGSEELSKTYSSRAAIIRGTDMPNIRNGQFGRVPLRYVTPKKLASRRLIDGDIIIEISGGSKTQSTGRSLYVTKRLLDEFECDVVPASFCRLFRVRDAEISLLLAQHLSSIYAAGKMWNYQIQSTGLANFQTKHFLSHEMIVLPPKPIQRAFFELVRPLVDCQHSSRISTLTQLRDNLLPRLISGKLRLPDAQALIEEATP